MAAPPAENSVAVEALIERIEQLVGERQALRAESADLAALERNRLSIAQLQQQLSRALIERYRPAAAA